MRAPASHEANDSQPIEATIDRRRSRWLTSWQLWLAMLVAGIAGILCVLSIPFAQRAESLRYFDDQNAKLGFSDDDAWITERLGDWAKPLRRVTSIRCEQPSSHMWNHVARFDEVEYLDLPAEALTWESLAVLRQLPNLKVIRPQWSIADRDLRRALKSEWELAWPVISL